MPEKAIWLELAVKGVTVTFVMLAVASGVTILETSTVGKISSFMYG